MLSHTLSGRDLVHLIPPKKIQIVQPNPTRALLVYFTTLAKVTDSRRAIILIVSVFITVILTGAIMKTTTDKKIIQVSASIIRTAETDSLKKSIAQDLLMPDKEIEDILDEETTKDNPGTTSSN